MISLGNWRGIILVFTLVTSTAKVWANWDGDASLDEIDFNLESFIDINSYQFRPSEELRWNEVENGLRVAAGSLETNRLYLMTDLRLKQAITSKLTARMWLADEELYEPREFPRPLFELELQPTSYPLSVSLIGTPAYAKREADLGMALTLGQRPWNFVRVAWLSADHYFNDKNDLDDAYYRREPGQLTLEMAYQWLERYKLRLLWQENSPLEYVLDGQVAVFGYENKNYRVSFDYHHTEDQHYGVNLRGLQTRQALEEGESPRSQDIEYFSIDAYWFRELDAGDEWTLGLRFDDFSNQERTPADPMTAFDLNYRVVQAYSTYYHPFREDQALELGLYVGYANQEKTYLNAAVTTEQEDRIEAKLRTAWELFSADRRNALSIGVSLNLDEIIADPFDGGSVRLRTEF